MLSDTKCWWKGSRSGEFHDFAKMKLEFSTKDYRASTALGVTSLVFPEFLTEVRDGCNSLKPGHHASSVQAVLSLLSGMFETGAWNT